MNRIQKLFNTKNKDLLSVYFTAGYPTLDSAPEIINTLAAKGVDMIEVGVPFSDPMADGPTIQESSTKALANGMTLARVLDDVAVARRTTPDTPLALMGYLNPMMQYGIERLFARCKDVGIDALIIPDLPFGDYVKEFRALCERYDIPMIMLITPETSEDRIRLIDENCDGFIYMVSAAATTGTREGFDADQIDYFKRINAMSLRHNRLIGFGISNPVTLQSAFNNSSGAIVGSLFIKCLTSQRNITSAVDLLLDTLGVDR